MRYLPNGAQMKAADTYTIEKVGIPSLVLMERAALETVRVLKDRGVDFSDTLVVCGSGNNGGDGFAAARILKEYGFCAEVLFVGQDASMSEECRTQKQIAERLGISVFTDFPKKEYTVIIDAVFGVGLSRAIEGRYHTVIEWMNDKKCEKAAIDIPSGIMCGERQSFGNCISCRYYSFYGVCEVGMRIISGETVCRGNSISSDRNRSFFF